MGEEGGPALVGQGEESGLLRRRLRAPRASGVDGRGLGERDEVGRVGRQVGGECGAVTDPLVGQVPVDGLPDGVNAVAVVLQRGEGPSVQWIARQVGHGVRA